MTTTLTNQDAREAYPGKYPEQFGARAAELSAAAQALALDAFLATDPQPVHLSNPETLVGPQMAPPSSDVAAAMPPSVTATGDDPAAAARAALNDIFGGMN